MNRPNMTASRKPATSTKPRALNKAQARAWQPDELDASLQAHPTLDDAALVADSGKGAMMLASTGQTSVLGEVGSAETATVAEVDAGATISPAAIGAGIFGVAAVIAASGGGSGGSTPSAPQDSLQTNPNRPGASTQPPAGGKPGSDKTGTDDNTTPEGREPQAGGREPGNGTNDNTNASAPGDQNPGVAQATGPAEKPNVAASGNTQLKAETFTLTLPDGSVADHIRISNIQTSHGSLTDSIRMVRYGDDDAKPSDAQGLFSRITLKAPGDAAAAINTIQTGYEVYVPATGPITQAQARALAEKLGGKLLVIDDRKEADWLQNAFKHQLHDHKVWIDSHALETANVAQRTGPAPDQLTLTYSTESTPDTRLPAFIIEYANYQHPLMLKKDGTLLPITEGQIIPRADLDKLIWNADNNAHATLVIEAVDSADPATAKPIEHGEQRISRVIKLSEDPSIQPAPATNDVPGQTDAPQGDGHPHGGNSHGPGEHTPGQNHQGGHGNQHQGGAQGGSNAQPGAGASPNAGGNQNDGGPRNGSGGTNDTTPSSKPLPSYDGTAQHVAKVAHDSETAAIDASIFHGKTPTNAPEFVLISGIQASDTATKPVLSYEDPNGKKHVIPNDTKGYNLARELYETLSWDSVAGNSGSFSFTPADAQGKPLPGAVKQNVSVSELPAPARTDNDQEDDAPDASVPHYSNTATIEVHHGATATPLGGALFKGDNPTAPARFIEILSIKVEGDTENSPDVDAPTGTLKNGDTPLIVGRKVADTDFGKISWDASKGQGGHFSFRPVADIQGTGIEGAPTQFVRIFEHPAVPTYESDDALTPTHDQTDFKIPAERLLGNQNPSQQIRIISINGEDDAQADTPLMLEGSSVKAGTLLTAEQVAKLSWDASKAENGTIVFRAMADALGTRAVLGSTDQTLQITEQPAAPVPSVDGGARTDTLPADDSGAVNTRTQTDKVKLAWESLFNHDDITLLDMIGKVGQQHEAGTKPNAISPSDQPAPPLAHSESHSMLASNLLKSVLPEDFGTH